MISNVNIYAFLTFQQWINNNKHVFEQILLIWKVQSFELKMLLWFHFLKPDLSYSALCSFKQRNSSLPTFKPFWFYSHMTSGKFLTKLLDIQSSQFLVTSQLGVEKILFNYKNLKKAYFTVWMPRISTTVMGMGKDFYLIVVESSAPRGTFQTQT